MGVVGILVIMSGKDYSKEICQNDELISQYNIYINIKIIEILQYDDKVVRINSVG